MEELCYDDIGISIGIKNLIHSNRLFDDLNEVYKFSRETRAKNSVCRSNYTVKAFIPYRFRKLLLILSNLSEKYEFEIIKRQIFYDKFFLRFKNNRNRIIEIDIFGKTYEIQIKSISSSFDNIMCPNIFYNQIEEHDIEFAIEDMCVYLLNSDKK